MTGPEYLDNARKGLRYDPDTGQFIWLVRTHGMGGLIMPGDIAGCDGGQGYLLVGYKGKQYRAHRLAYLFMTGDWPADGMDVDHVNGNREDNRWCNLRLATRSQNNCNGGVRHDNKSGCRGVSFSTKEGKWDARITVNGKLHLLGRHERMEDAIAARKQAEQKLCGDWLPEQRKARLRHT